MPAPTTRKPSRSVAAAMIGVCLAAGVTVSASANVITDWDEKGIAAVAPLAGVIPPYSPYAAYRMMAIVHAAMFDAVNSIEPRYRPYLIQVPADTTTSKEAAAATAAATVLATIDLKNSGGYEGRSRGLPLGNTGWAGEIRGCQAWRKSCCYHSRSAGERRQRCA